MSKPRILVTASTFPRWKNDTEPTFVYELTKRLTHDFDVSVLSPYANGSQVFEEIDNVTIYRYKYMPFGLGTLAYDGGIVPKLKNNKFHYIQIPFFLLFQLLALRRIIKTQQIRIIHAHWIIPQGVMAVLYKMLFNKKIKLLSTIHGGDIFTFQHRIGIWMKRFVLNNIDTLTVVSTAIKQEVEQIGYQKDILVYPMGVDTTLFHPYKYDKRIKEEHDMNGDYILFVGRLAEKKGVEYLLHAMPEVLKRYPLSKLLIIGTGVLREELVKVSQELSIEGSVLFTGAIAHKDLPAYFATADVFVGPSIVASKGDREGLGLVFVEAMSCGTPVVATDLPAIADIVRNNETGFIVKQRTSGEISERIITLLDNKSKLHEMKMQARKYVVQHYDWGVIVNKYIQCIRSTLGHYE